MYISLYGNKGMIQFKFSIEKILNNYNEYEYDILAFITAIPAVPGAVMQPGKGIDLNKDAKFTVSATLDELLLLRSLVLKEIQQVHIVREDKSLQFNLVQDNNNANEYLILVNAISSKTGAKFTIPIKLIPFRYKFVHILDYIYNEIIKNSIKIFEKNNQQQYNNNNQNSNIQNNNMFNQQQNNNNVFKQNNKPQNNQNKLFNQNKGKLINASEYSEEYIPEAMKDLGLT